MSNFFLYSQFTCILASKYDSTLIELFVHLAIDTDKYKINNNKIWKRWNCTDHVVNKFHQLQLVLFLFFQFNCCEKRLKHIYDWNGGWIVVYRSLCTTRCFWLLETAALEHYIKINKQTANDIDSFKYKSKQDFLVSFAKWKYEMSVPQPNGKMRCTHRDSQ